MCSNRFELNLTFTGYGESDLRHSGCGLLPNVTSEEKSVDVRSSKDQLLTCALRLVIGARAREENFSSPSPAAGSLVGGPAANVEEGDWLVTDFCENG